MAKPPDPAQCITASQLVLHTLQGAGTPLSQHDLMRRAQGVAEHLTHRGFRVKVFFRSPYCGNVWSEQVEGTLWYWLSNGFITEGPSDGRLVLSDSGERLFSKQGRRTAIRGDLDDQALSVLESAARKVVPSE